MRAVAIMPEGGVCVCVGGCVLVVELRVAFCVLSFLVVVLLPACCFLRACCCAALSSGARVVAVRGFY